MDIPLPNPRVERPVERAVARPSGTARHPTSFAWPTLALVRSVPAAAREGCLTAEHLAEAAHLVADDARGQGLPVERLLVALEREWTGLVDVRQMAPHDASELLERLVTLCLRAYYRDGADDVAPTGSPARLAVEDDDL